MLFQTNSAAWVTALGKLAAERAGLIQYQGEDEAGDSLIVERAGLMEMGMKNALKGKDLLVVLRGHEADIMPQKRQAKR